MELLLLLALQVMAGVVVVVVEMTGRRPGPCKIMSRGAWSNGFTRGKLPWLPPVSLAGPSKIPSSNPRPKNRTITSLLSELAPLAAAVAVALGLLRRAVVGEGGGLILPHQTLRGPPLVVVVVLVLALSLVWDLESVLPPLLLREERVVVVMVVVVARPVFPRLKTCLLLPVFLLLLLRKLQLRAPMPPRPLIGRRRGCRGE